MYKRQVTGGLAAIVLWFGSDFFAGLIKTPYSSYALKTLAPTIWIMAYLGVLRGYFQGTGTMIPTAISQILEQVINAIVSVEMCIRDRANPWAHAAEKYAAGSVVTGRVARMTDFGAFVELEPGVDALLHVSQISREHIEKPADVLKIGQEIEAKVVDFNEDDHKISLSVKALQAAPQNEDVADVDLSLIHICKNNLR